MTTLLKRLHSALYPSDSKYFWYRQGLVKTSSIERKYGQLIMTLLVIALAGSASFMFPAILFVTFVMNEYSSTWLHLSNTSCLHDTSQFNNISGLARDATISSRGLKPYDFVQHSVSSPLFIATWMVVAGSFTLAIYYLGASRMQRKYYSRDRAQASEWKIQPNHFPSEKLLRKERFWGCLNAAIAGAMGTGLFFLHQHYALFKFHYSMPSLADYLRDCAIVYVYVDLSAYWFHRLMHTRLLYKRVHKLHHTWKQPTPFSAFAMNPLEYIGFQLSGISIAFFYPVHIMSLLTIVAYIAVHNMVDHSGIFFEGDLPWTPSAQFHDDHHRLFHLNLGLTLLVWDWLFGTLRQADRVYGEENLVGEQEKRKLN